MRSNKGRDTKPELALRRILHARGYRYRVDYAPLDGLRSRADVVFTRMKVAVFVDGCFWHGCPVHATYPKTNTEYWLPKLERNRERDQQTNSILEASGWTVLRYWEHEPVDLVASSVAEVLIDRVRIR